MIVRLKPYLEPKIWGSRTLNNRYQCDIDTPIGEAWGISMIKHKESFILDGNYQGMPFSILYEKEPQLFGGLKGTFPLLVKIIDAKDDLSIQVHPREGEFEKNECWYILHAKKDACLTLGHKAVNKNQFLEALNQHKLNKLLIEVPVKQNDLFYINSGKLHGIGKGIELLEIQQASDTTYRVYDYHRSINGHERELHLTHALQEMRFPDEEIKKEVEQNYFNLEKVTCHHQLDMVSDQFGDYLYIVNGDGSIGEKEVKKHEFIFISSNEKYRINGEMDILKSTIIKGLTN
jgi:mannose-6-phosphate isomerase